MISKLKKEYYLLKFFKKTTELTDKKEKKVFNKIFKIVSSPTIIIAYSLFILFFDFDNESLLVTILNAIFGVPMCIVLFYFLIFLFISTLNAIFQNKIKYMNKYSSQLIDHVRPLSGGYFCSKNLAIKVNNKISQISHNSLDKILGQKLNSEFLFKTATESIIKDTNKEDIINNIDIIVSDFDNSGLKIYNKIFYDIFLTYLFKNLTYESFNKYKVTLVNIIENNFNEFEQQKYLEELSLLKSKLDDNIIRNNVNKYKKHILNNEDNVQKTVLKSL